VAFQDAPLLEQWVSFDRKRLRVSVEAEFQSAARRTAVLAGVREQVRRLLPPDWSVELTGPYAVGHEWVRDVQATQLSSFASSLAAVFVLMALHLRSLRFATLALVPTVLPAVAVVGAMGLLGLSLDVGRAMIGAIVLGIGVDDTIHLLDRWRREDRLGHAPAEAMRRAVRFAGRGVITTSLALALGFLSLMVSSWQSVSSFGFFAATGIVFALAADLLVLPALIGAVPARGAR
jgi:predicted RND superfamily exporter protein